MIHFTHTGYHAGQVFCGINKDEFLTAQFMHVPYGWTDEKIKEKVANGEVCPYCAKLWIEAGEN